MSTLNTDTITNEAVQRAASDSEATNAAVRDRIAQFRSDDNAASNDQNLWIPGGRAFPEDDRRSHRILIKTSVGALAGRHARAHG
ncbi:hypothetical protein IU418_17855, partial [Nocardia farcinica]|uniref:hypothetical protein n=1 Tax=Nocardia farcinica TaxID=37329 RepID=UPI001B3C9BFA